MIRNCLNCNKILTHRSKIRFCSNQCQADYRYRQFIKKWKNKSVPGTIGITVKSVSGHVRRYLIEKAGEKCSMCGWGKKHTLTRKVPLEVDHIDGNSENNLENNLRLLCPNCHSLTPYFRNLNKGKGRKWRMDKYIKNSTK